MNITLANSVPARRVHTIRLGTFSPDIPAVSTVAGMPTHVTNTRGSLREVRIRATMEPYERLELARVEPATEERDWPQVDEAQARACVHHVLDTFAQTITGSVAPGDLATVVHLPGGHATAHGMVRLHDFVVEVWFYLSSGSQIAEWEILCVQSNPDNPSRARVPLGRVHVGYSRLIMRPDFPAFRHLDLGTLGFSIRPTLYGDAQGQAWRGWCLMLPDGYVPTLEDATTWNAVCLGPAYAVADSWRDELKPYRDKLVVPASGDRAAVLASYHDTLAVPPTPWTDRPLWGLSANSGDTGSQDDFGVIGLGEVVALPGLSPLFLHKALCDSLQEACRTTNFRERDGSPVDPIQHPRLVYWDGYLHWSLVVSPDQLGKVGPRPSPPTSADPGKNWYGPDREHWSQNVLFDTYAMTASHLLGRLVERNRGLYLGMETVKPGLSTSTPGPERAIGRTMQMVARLLRTHGDDGLRRRVQERIDLNARDCYQASGPVDPIQVLTDPRVLDGKTAWRPYFHGICALGLWQVARQLDPPQAEAARALAKRAVIAAIRHGWKSMGGGGWLCYEAVAVMPGDQPVPEEDYAPKGVRLPSFLTWSTGNGNAWGLPLATLALTMPDMPADVESKAREILTWARNVMVTGDPFQKVREWLATP